MVKTVGGTAFSALSVVVAHLSDWNKTYPYYMSVCLK